MIPCSIEDLVCSYKDLSFIDYFFVELIINLYKTNKNQLIYFLLIKISINLIDKY